MTRLSDSLRSLADRAPLEDASVSVTSAARRVRRGRRLRVAANATAGAGVAAVMALAALNPTVADSASDAAAAAPGDGKEMMPAYDESAGFSDMMLAWGSCGSAVDTTSVEAGAGSLTLAEPSEDLLGGDRATFGGTLVGPATGDFDTVGPQMLVVWQGIVVGTGTVDGATSSTVTLEEGASSDVEIVTDLVNCWDGAYLPGGDYTVVGYQDFSSLPVEEPVVVEPKPSEEPSAAPTASGRGSDSSSGSAGIDVGEPAPGDAIVVSGTFIRLVSEPVVVTLGGDVYDDPFGQYLYPVTTYPDTYLFPDIARELYAANATSSRWTMEPGTQRVTIANDSAAIATDQAWTGHYFGCAWEGGPDGSFPDESAELDLVTVDAKLPRGIDIEYGWVVKDNPAIAFEVTNTSDYTLPGFWGQPNSSLVLVKDGVVVAESYLVAADLTASYTTQESTGYLDPGASLGGTYLWRDLTGCWTGTGQTVVKPGTYTVVNVQYLYLDSGSGGMVQPFMGAYTDDALLSDGAASSDGARAEAEAVAADLATAVAPGYGGTYDWLELQVWTSLGEVTLS